MNSVFDDPNNPDNWEENDWEFEDYLRTTDSGYGSPPPSGNGRGIAALIIPIVIIVAIIGSCTAVFQGAKAANRCIVSGCKNERQSSWTSYCSVHGCQYPLCSRTPQKGGKYCIEHTCKKPGCMDRVVTYDGYCEKHKPKYKTCAVSGCKNNAVTGGTYCYYHTCDVEGCYRVAYTVLGSSYCSDHKCAYSGCPNKALTKGGMCEKHKGKKSPAKSETKSKSTNKSKAGSSKSSKDRDDAEALYEDYEGEFEDMDEAEEYWEEEYDG